jgi:hypothetical protein
MAKRHVMTPARRAALKKAQLASARKRRKGRVRREYKRKTAMAKKRYKGPGGSYKMHKDRLNSTGPYTRGMTGKKYGKKMKIVNRASMYVASANPGYSGVVLGSYVRGRRAGTIKKRKR